MSGKYGIREVFCTLQGEGLRAGAKSVFVRFSGCNLWDGNPLHRDQGEGPCALWCDTDFQKGTVMSTEALLEAMDQLWPLESASRMRWCVLSGGEPALQVDDQLIDALHDHGWLIAVETNGTVSNHALRQADHICLSPKFGTAWEELSVLPHEVKVILPGAAYGARGWKTEDLNALAANWQNDVRQPALYLQPQDPIVEPLVKDITFLRRASRESDVEEEERLAALFNAHLAACIRHVMAHPEWRLSLQTHKYTNLP